MPHVMLQERKFPCVEFETSGMGNNCLGYALAPILKVTPVALRMALVDFFERSDDDLQKFLSYSILQSTDGSVTEARHALAGSCFIPADVFIAFCQYGKRNDVLHKRNSVVFFKREGDAFIPVCFYKADNAFHTEYVVCDGTHYQRILFVSQSNEQLFQILFFKEV